jgi:hypothetical protein
LNVSTVPVFTAAHLTPNSIQANLVCRAVQAARMTHKQSINVAGSGTKAAVLDAAPLLAVAPNRDRQKLTSAWVTVPGEIPPSFGN